MRTFSWRSLVVCGLVVAAGVVGRPAVAHDQVVSQFPVAGAQLAAAPERVTVTFVAAPLDIGAVVLVVDPSGRNWAGGVPRVRGATVEQPLVGTLVDGNYQVRWRVVSGDGHPISETFPFSVGDTAGAPGFAAPTTRAPSGPDNANQGEFALTDAVDVAADPGADSTRTVLFGVGGAVVGLLVFTAGVFAAGRRRRADRALLEGTTS